MPGGIWRATYERRGNADFLVLRGEKDGWQAEEWLELIFWRPRFGGLTLWLLCPACGNRCRKLYAPPGMAKYRCRGCWGLAYASSQEAHHWDRGTIGAMNAEIAVRAGCTLREVVRALYPRGKR